MIDASMSDSAIVYSVPLQLGVLACCPASSAANRSSAFIHAAPQLMIHGNMQPVYFHLLGLWDDGEPAEMCRKLSHERIQLSLLYVSVHILIL